jgi:hypothetical protein
VLVSITYLLHDFRVVFHTLNQRCFTFFRSGFIVDVFQILSKDFELRRHQCDHLPRYNVDRGVAISTDKHTQHLYKDRRKIMLGRIIGQPPRERQTHFPALVDKRHQSVKSASASATNPERCGNNFRRSYLGFNDLQLIVAEPVESGIG